PARAPFSGAHPAIASAARLRALARTRELADVDALGAAGARPEDVEAVAAPLHHVPRTGNAVQQVGDETADRHHFHLRVRAQQVEHLAGLRPAPTDQAAVGSLDDVGIDAVALVLDFADDL